MAATRRSHVDGLTQAERSALSDAQDGGRGGGVDLRARRGRDDAEGRRRLRAGYSRGLASYRFGSKAGLWSFLVRTIGEEWLAELQRGGGRHLGLDTIHAAVDAHCRFLLESSDRIRAFYILWFESVGPDPDAAGGDRRRPPPPPARRRGVDHERASTPARSAPTSTSAASPSSSARRSSGSSTRGSSSPLAHPEVRRLHDGLKQQMTRALESSRGVPAPSPTRSPRAA